MPLTGVVPSSGGGVGSDGSDAAAASSSRGPPPFLQSREASTAGGLSESRGDLSRDNSFSDNSRSDYASALERKEKARKQAAAEALLVKAAVGGGKSITYWGGVAFLVNNVTGGGMVLFPAVFQQAGWLVTIAGLLSIMLLACVCGFMLIEAMAMMPGNKRFGKRAEYTSITKHFLPRKAYILSQIFFNLSLSANMISMIVQSIQVMDFTIAELFGASCTVPQLLPSFAVGCPSPVDGYNTVFGPGVYAVPLGWFVLLLIVLPLGMVNLDDNIFVQKGAFISVAAIFIIWIALFVGQGLDATRVPVIGDNFTQVLGVIVFNFAAITSVPSWVNEKKESVSIERSFMLAFPVAVGMFVVLGLMGGLAFAPSQFENGQTILSAVFGLNTKIAKVTFFLFPACVNLTSIPVFSIMQRYNLVESGLCGKKMALFLAGVLPWLISIPLYTGRGYELLITWSGILITSTVNYIVPPILYILAIREVKVELQKRASVRMLSGITANQLAGLSAQHAQGAGSRGAATGSADKGSGGEKDGTHNFGRLATNSKAFDLTALNKQSTQSKLEAEERANMAGASGDPTADHVVEIDPAAAEHQAKLHAQTQRASTFAAAAALSKAQLDEIVATALREKAERKAARRQRKREKEELDRTVTAMENARKKEQHRKRKRKDYIADDSELPQPPLKRVDPFAPPSPAGRWRWRQIVWALMLPVAVGMHYTIPHPAAFAELSSVPSSVHGVPVTSVPRLVSLAVLSLLCSVGWLVGLSYVLVWCGSLLTDATSFHPLLLGMFVIGVGTRAPAFLTELRGYRSGTGDLNRLFLNNVLQVLLCVPLPWLLHHAMHGAQPVFIYSGVITVMALSLFIMGSLVVIIFRSHDWAGDRRAVVPLLALGAFFVIEATMLDYGVILGLTDGQCVPE